MAPTYRALSEEAQREIKPQFDSLWRSEVTKSPMNDDPLIGVILLGTMVAGADNFDYLPTEERVKIFTYADLIFRLGFLLGRAPKPTADLLHSVKHLLVKFDPPEWVSPLLEDYKTE